MIVDAPHPKHTPSLSVSNHCQVLFYRLRPQQRQYHLCRAHLQDAERTTKRNSLLRSQHKMYVFQHDDPSVDIDALALSPYLKFVQKTLDCCGS